MALPLNKVKFPIFMDVFLLSFGRNLSSVWRKCEKFIIRLTDRRKTGKGNKKSQLSWSSGDLKIRFQCLKSLLNRLKIYKKQQQNKRRMGHNVHLRKLFKSITQMFITMLNKRRINSLSSLWELNCCSFKQTWIPLHPRMLRAKFGWNLSSERRFF